MSAHREVVDTGKRLHILDPGGQTLCMRYVDQRDRYDTTEAGWRVWAAHRERRCFYCASAALREMRAA
jgi:hypothetical protein